MNTRHLMRTKHPVTVNQLRNSSGAGRHELAQHRGDCCREKEPLFRGKRTRQERRREQSEIRCRRNAHWRTIWRRCHPAPRTMEVSVFVPWTTSRSQLPDITWCSCPVYRWVLVQKLVTLRRIRYRQAGVPKCGLPGAKLEHPYARRGPECFFRHNCPSLLCCTIPYNKGSKGGN
jgi:hypothetical protein